MSALGFINNQPINRKIGGLVGMLLLLSAGSSFFGISKMRAIGEEMSSVQTEIIPLMELVNSVTISQLEKAVKIEKAMHLDGDGSRAQELGTEISALGQRIELNIKRGETALAGAKTGARSDDVYAVLEALEASLSNVASEHRAYQDSIDGLLGKLIEGRSLSSYETIGVIQAQEALEQNLRQLTVGVGELTTNAIALVKREEGAAIQAMILLGALSVVFGLLVSVLIARAITIPLRSAVAATEQLAEGDLTINFQSEATDETGQLLSAMGAMSSKISSLIRQISAATEHLSSATSDVLGVTTQTARNIETQTENLDQTSVAMNQMSLSAHDVAQHAASAASAAKQAESEAGKGRQIVDQAYASVISLSGDIENAKDSINRLHEETQNVDTILAVITSIADQTNLLALNASIEAARAGEQGRGFAVVADEVRSLANRTQKSTGDIQELINKLKNEAATSVAAMERGHSEAEVTVSLTQNAAQVLQTVTMAVDQITEMNLQIASASEEQTTVAEQVNAAISQINDSQKDNSAGAQQISIATAELAELSKQLRKQVSQFRVTS